MRKTHQYSTAQKVLPLGGGFRRDYNYDFGFRQLDPQLGRWHVTDALAEKYYTTSGYAYTLNDPINHIDIMGLLPYRPPANAHLGTTFHNPGVVFNFLHSGPKGNEVGPTADDYAAFIEMGGGGEGSSFSAWYSAGGRAGMNVAEYGANVGGTTYEPYQYDVYYQVGTPVLSALRTDGVKRTGFKKVNYWTTLGGIYAAEDIFNKFIYTSHKVYTTTGGVVRNIADVNSIRALQFASRSKLLKNLGNVGTGLMVGVASYNIYVALDNNQEVDNWDIADFAVGTLGLVATGVVVFTPVGWVGAAAVGAGYFVAGYSTFRTGQEIYNYFE